MPRSKRKQAVVAEASEDGEPPLPAAVNEAQDTIVGNMAAADDEALGAMDVVPDEPVKLSRREQRKLKKSDADGGVVGADVNSDAGASAPTAAAHQPLDANSYSAGRPAERALLCPHHSDRSRCASQALPVKQGLTPLLPLCPRGNSLRAAPTALRRACPTAW
jgi:hypothetical protein